MNPPRHRPVMRAEVLALLAPRDGERFVDGTFGAGGYSLALLEAADCVVYGIDRDPEALAEGGALAARHPGRLHLVAGRFSQMERLLAGLGVGSVDGVALDLGVSSMQLDTPERGFSFRQDGPLDMRMQPEGPDAAAFVNGAEEAELARVIRLLGEERRARAVARAIVEARRRRPIARTADLAEIVAGAVGRGGGRTHPATRTFQAIRMHVNDELGELTRGLGAAERLLSPEGRLAVVSFHSLEDREVKRFLRRRGGGEGGSRHRPPADVSAASFVLAFRGARMPSEAETRLNPRARSARLRGAVRTAAPALEAA